nr:unnamed protein product [Callosobruchus chinensis]
MSAHYSQTLITSLTWFRKVTMMCWESLRRG